jgi:hypothetical protein
MSTHGWCRGSGEADKPGGWEWIVNAGSHDSRAVRKTLPVFAPDNFSLTTADA